MSEPTDDAPGREAPEEGQAIVPRDGTPEEFPEGEREAVDQLFAVLDKVPFVSGFKRDVTSLSAMIRGRRPPRVLAIGAPGSGRSQLANALLGEPVLRVGPAGDAPDRRWLRVDAAGRRIDWMEIAARGDTTELMNDGEGARAPDVVIAFVTPAEAERGAGRVLELALAARALGGETPLPLIAVLGRADAVEPEAAAAPFPADKELRIAGLKRALRRQLVEAGLPKETPLHAVATPSAGEHRLGIAPWNLGGLAESLASAVPAAARVEAARAFPDAVRTRRKVASDLIESCSTLAITVALSPIPLSDIAVIVPLQTTMVTAIAYLSGRRWSPRAAGEWLTSAGLVAGAGWGMRTAARQVLKLVPGAGSVVGAGMAGAGTLALGRSAMKYYL
ncbi:MAG: hypothetical protein AAF447_08295 [Myxococcota bacterium]